MILILDSKTPWFYNTNKIIIQAHSPWFRIFRCNFEITQVIYDVLLYLARSLFAAARIGGRLLYDVGIVIIRGRACFFRWTAMKIYESFFLKVIVLVSYNLK